MTTFTFTEVQIIDVWLSSPEKVNELNSIGTFCDLKEHFKNFNVRLEPGIDYRLMGRDFYIKLTNQIQEQIPSVAGMLSHCIEQLGFNKCSVSW